MFLASFETLAKQEIHQVVCDLPDQMGGFRGQRSKEQFASSLSLKFGNFELYPRISRRNGCCSNQRSFHQLLLVVGENGLKWRVTVRKAPWWNQEVKEAIRAKKDAFKVLLQDRLSSDLQSRYTEARKAATSAVKKSKEKSWEEFGRRLDSNHFLANKVFWPTIRRLCAKRSSVTSP